MISVIRKYPAVPNGHEDFSDDSQQYIRPRGIFFLFTSGLQCEDEEDGDEEEEDEDKEEDKEEEEEDDPTDRRLGKLRPRKLPRP